jgi:hypothetical protein
MISMKLVVSALLSSALLLSIISRAATLPSDEIVPMAPFKVTSGGFELDVSCDGKTKVVRAAVVSWVRGGAERPRLRIGDLLVSIDDKPVKGSPLDEFLELIGQPLRVGDVQKLTFSGSGSSGSSRRITWLSRGPRPATILNGPPSELPPENKPNKSPEPTRTSVLSFRKPRPTSNAATRVAHL